MPDVHSVMGRISLTASPAIVAGKGFTVSRQGTGEWNITLNRPIPGTLGDRVQNISFITLGATAEDITCKAQIVSSTVIRLRTFTGATLTDPNAATQGSFRIDYMFTALPK